MAVAWVAQAQTLTVLAAASLRESFTQLATGFEQAHPGVHVRISFGGSQQLAASILLAAPADVFASADVPQMQRVVSGGKATPHAVQWLCGNQLVIVTNGNRSDLKSLADLSRPGVRIALAKPKVPVGEYSDKVLTAATRLIGAVKVAAIRRNVVVRDDDVRAVLLHVSLGEADAGIVYATDVAAAKKQVGSAAIPNSLQPKVDYEIAPLSGSGQAALARQFTEYVLGPAGRQALARRGFVVAEKRRR